VREADWQRFWERVVGLWETYKKRGLIGVVVVAVRWSEKENDYNVHAKYRLEGGLADRGVLVAGLELAKLHIIGEMFVEYEPEKTPKPQP